jgi:hypothetical protein
LRLACVVWFCGTEQLKRMRAVAVVSGLAVAVHKLLATAPPAARRRKRIAS